MANRIQVRRDTSANWTSVNPILTQGELGYEINTGRLKVGNGITAWNLLPYFSVSYNDVSGAPTTLSDLTNDLGFITAADLPANELPVNAVGYLRNDGNGVLTWSATPVPTATSQLTNDSGYITAADLPAPTDFNNFAGDIIPDADATRSLGSATRQWKEIFVSTGSIYIGNVKLSNSNGTLQINTVETQIDPDTQEEIEVVLETESVQFTRTSHLELTGDYVVFDPYAGTLVEFIKTDYGTEVDQIDTGLSITRLNNQGIFNPLKEPDWDNTSSDGPSPAGTLWNKDGWGDLTNLNQRTYFSFYDTFLRFGNNVVTAEAVMKDVANNKYYKFDFIQWGNFYQGAPVRYIRTEIDPVTGAEIGIPVEFIKAGYADPAVVNDPIDTNLTLARANQYSIFNIALEPAYNSVGDGEDSPEGTLWNAEGWGQLRDVKTRTYVPFREALNYAIGENILGKELVMYDIDNDKYYAVKFSSWTQNGNGGGFAYTRQLINVSQYFVHTDYGNEVDILIPNLFNSGMGVGITRDSGGGAIFNPYREGSWDDTISPSGTLWNVEGWTDLTDIATRTYQSFYDAFGQGGIGNKVIGTECIMYVPEIDKYYAVKFSSWTQGGNGGGFAYTRYELNPANPGEGITFADGTTLTTAKGLSRVKSTASGDRRIEEAAGNKTITLTARVTTNLTTAASRTETGSFYIWFDSTATTIDDIINNPANYSNAYGFEFSLDNITWYAWTGGLGSSGVDAGYSISQSVTYLQGDTIYFRYQTGGTPVVWWDKNDLPSGGSGFRGAVIDYHAYTGDATYIGTIHIVDDDGEEHITHTEVSSGSSNSNSDDLWLVENEGTISYRRLDGQAKIAKFHWTAKVFYGSELYD